jgi:hypothetical protein
LKFAEAALTASIGLTLLATLPHAVASDIVPVGVIGNSGVEGNTLFRAEGFDPANAAGGVYIDAAPSAWVSGGNGIVRMGLDGRVIERFALEPAGSRVDSTAFARIGGTLYFLGWVPGVPGTPRALFALPLVSGAKATPVKVKLPEVRAAHRPPRLGAHPWNGMLTFAAELKDAAEPTIAVYHVDPSRANVSLAFTVPGEAPESLIYDDANARIYVGGLVVKRGNRYAPGVVAFGVNDRKIAQQFEKLAIPTPTIPTRFIGRLSLLMDGLWDSSIVYGFLAKLRMDFTPDPGIVARWMHELDQPTQMAAVGPAGGAAAGVQPFVIATNVPDASYLAQWDPRNNELRLVGRLGGLPQINSLGLSADGWITVATAHTQLWWKWEDDAAAAPRMADMSVAAGGGFFSGDRFFAFGALRDMSELKAGGAVPLIFRPLRIHANYADRPTGMQPIRALEHPASVSLLPGPGELRAHLLVTDTRSSVIHRVPVDARTLKPEGEKRERIEVRGTTLLGPTDFVPLADGLAVLADPGRVLFLRQTGLGYEVDTSWNHADGAGGAIGRKLRIAAHGNWVLVSDADRHRVLWLDWRNRTVLGQFGEADKSGDGPAQLNTPTYVALQGTRAVVADTRNQRVIKLQLRP